MQAIRNLNYEYIRDTSHIERIRSVITEGITPIQFDTETTGLDPHEDSILLYQFGNGRKQFVVDNRAVPVTAFKDILEDRRRAKILHNAKFDYKMLKSEGITMEGARDTQLAEYCLTAGLQRDGRDLGTVAAKYLGIRLDKEMQESFIGMSKDAVFSERQIAYAAADVALLEDILNRQWVPIRKHGLHHTAHLEFNVMPAFADMEYYGIPLDKDRWLNNVEGSVKGLKQVIASLDDWAVDNRFADRNFAGEVSINWASPKDLLIVLNKTFVNRGETKLTSSDDATLERLWDKFHHPILSQLREFRDLSKRTGTYGMAYLKFLHPKTGCIHPEFNQYGTATGRPTGKQPNMLNIPRDKNYREAFRAPEGYDVHTKDYSGAELRIVASMSGDHAMCEAYNQGKDLHSYVAAKFMQRDYDEFIKLVKAKDQEACDIRQAVKAINFGGQ